MSNAWEITSDDIKQVLEPQGVKFTDLISDMVDDAEVEEAVLSYCNFDNQVDASLCNIEDQLIEAGVITGPKMFDGPSDDDTDDWEDDDDFEET
jgi:hypothetical protein